MKVVYGYSYKEDFEIADKVIIEAIFSKCKLYNAFMSALVVIMFVTLFAFHLVLIMSPPRDIWSLYSLYYLMLICLGILCMLVHRIFAMLIRLLAAGIHARKNRKKASFNLSNVGEPN
jgi:hypothetical protein